MIRNGIKLPKCTPKNILSVAYHDLIRRCVQALLNPKIVKTDGDSASACISDENVLYEFPRSQNKSGSGDLVGPLLFKSKEDDYIICRSWDGATEGSVDIFVALPPKLRAVSSEVIDGDTVTYSAYDNGAQTRHADNGTDEEDQVITPRFLEDDFIYAKTALTLVDDGDGDPIPLLMDNTDSRAWLEVRDA